MTAAEGLIAILEADVTNWQGGAEPYAVNTAYAQVIVAVAVLRHDLNLPPAQP